MFSDILSAIKSIFDITNSIKAEKVKSVFISSDFKAILFYSLMITLTSPVFFSQYTELWNKIF